MSRTPDDLAPHDFSLVIEPPRQFALNLRELWSYRELASFMTWRDFKVRYKQTALGAAWAVIQPLMMMVVFTAVLGRQPGLRPEGIPYPVYTFAALVPWTLFSSTVTGSSNSLVVNANILTKIYFPRLLLPVSSAGVYLVDFLIAFVVLILMAIVMGVSLGPALLVLPAFVLLAVLAALAVGIWLSAVNVKYRDVKYAVPFLLQFGLFASPVAYGLSTVPEQWQLLYSLNPMVGVLEGFRWAFFGGPFPVAPLAVSLAVTSAVLLVALLYFRRVENTFADVV